MSAEITAEIEKVRAVVREVYEAGQVAMMHLARAEAWNEEHNSTKASHALADAKRRTLAVYAKIGTLRHDGPQPKPVPA